MTITTWRTDEPPKDGLRDCPFCGCMAVLVTDPLCFPAPGHRIECQGDCHSMTCWWHTKEEARDHWNRRQIPGPFDVIVTVPEPLSFGGVPACSIECILLELKCGKCRAGLSNDGKPGPGCPHGPKEEA